MHTAKQLKKELFESRINGETTALLPDWGPLDRFGIVVHEPFGAIGASFLLQAAIAEWYAVRPDRLDQTDQIYPDFFLFHAGGPHGDHTYFDLFPTRKEVFVENTPMALLAAINDRGITHLAVPDRPVERVQHEYKEPRQAYDRIRSAWAYSSSGRVANADLTISAKKRVVEANTKLTLNAAESYSERQQAQAAVGQAPVPENELVRVPASRNHEVSKEVRDRILAEREDLLVDGVRTESYRRITVPDALGMLHHGTAPAFLESETWPTD
nr:hypothetical protein [Rhodococcus sp. (in: high G+C Gram-positive bacteria)]